MKSKPHIIYIARTGIIPPQAGFIAYGDGFSFTEFSAFAKRLGLPEATLAKALGFSMSTVTRRKAKCVPLSPVESDSLIGAARIYHKATQFFEGDEPAARRWMLRACPAFAGRTPMECVRFGEKRARVLEFLDASINGVAFS